MAKEILGIIKRGVPRRGHIFGGYPYQGLPNHAEQARPSEDFHWRTEGGIRRGTIVIGGKTAQELEQAMAQGGINISTYAQAMLRRLNLPVRGPQELELAIMRLRDDLGLEGYPTLSQIVARGEGLGYERVPAETAVHLGIAYKNHSPLGKRLVMAMDPITDSDGRPRVFVLVRYGDGLWLGGPRADPDGRWPPGSEFVFGPRK